tara:strand:+ start:599 stop:934 length:336 start_codon:yes stop_codon:yes gene_type:complete
MAVLAKAKGQVYANEAERIKLEDYYRKAWIAKNLEDVEKKPELKIKSHFKSQKQMKKNSEPVVKKKPLPKQAKIINNMLSEGKSPRQVAKTLFENVKYVTKLISKYNLPKN